MSFKKLHPSIKEALASKGFEIPLPFQKKVLPKIKSGVNVFGIAPEGSGKTTALIISTIHKLKASAYEDAPRALIFVKDKEAALRLEEEFRKFTRHTDLRIYTAHEGPDIEDQKIDIYYGMDIVIGTSTMLHRIFLISGLNLSQLKMVGIEDAEFIVGSKDFRSIVSISDHISKCQYLVFATDFNSKMERLKDLFMENSLTVQQKETT